MANVLVALRTEYQGTRGLARSTDQGQNWTQVYTASSNVMSVCNTPTGFSAITYDGHHLTSTDGISWTDAGSIHANATTCADIEYIGNNTLVVANGLGGLVSTAFISYNMGTSWSVLLSHPYAISRVLKMGLDGKALLLGYHDQATDTRYVSKTTNYGQTWAAVTVTGNVRDNDAVYLGSGVVLACGQDAVTTEGTVFKSYDYGNDWTSVFTLSGYRTNSIGWLKDTTVAFVSMFQGDGGNSDRCLYKSSDSGSTWPTLVGSPGATALYGDSSSRLYSGRASIICPQSIPASSIAVSTDQGATFAYVTTQYAPMRFLMEEYIPPVPSSRPTQLDYRFLKTATNSGLEDDGVHAVRVKVKTGGGVVRDADGLSVDQSLVNQIVIEEHTITASDMTAKSFSLSQTMASTDQVAMTVYGGIPLNYGVDYTAVSSTAIGWNGLGLDGMIEAGDEVRLMYSD